MPVTPVLTLERRSKISEFMKLANEFPSHPRKEVQYVVDGPAMDIYSSFYVREEYTSKFGYSLPCTEAVEVLKTYLTDSEVLDVGAGTGYWGSLIQHYVHGSYVKAYDCGDPEWKHVFETPTEERFGFKPVPVIKEDAIPVVKEHPECNVFMAWPPYWTNFGNQIARAVAPGKILVLIGEGQGGCTGDDDLFATLDDQFDSLEFVKLPQFPTIHDCMEVYQRRVPKTA